jgi:hypothetical protein
MISLANEYYFERSLMHRLAGKKWEELKDALHVECELRSTQSKLTQTEVTEDDEHSFWINRVARYRPTIGAVYFTFDPAVPCVHWQDYQNKKLKKTLGFITDRTSVHIAEDNRKLILSRFVEQRLEAITQ